MVNKAIRILISMSLTTASVGNGATAGDKQDAAQRDLGYLVLGTISANAKSGVALIKDKKSKKAWAVRVGEKVSKDVSLASVDRKKVVFLVRGVLLKVRVGESVAGHYSSSAAIPSAYTAGSGGLQRQGDDVVVSESYKDHLVNNELNKILMQAAAVPNIKNGRLHGFTLFEITPDSIFEKLGFRNGDTVTSINGTELVDAGQAIKVLTSMKKAKNLAVGYTRSGSQKEMSIKIQ